MFYDAFDKFGEAIAIYDGHDDSSVTYAQLEKDVQVKLAELKRPVRQLVFIEAQSTPQTVVSYLACLRLGYPVHLLEALDNEKGRGLIESYRPNLLIKADGSVDDLGNPEITLHPDLLVLLSTSGSTGSSKFVKLSSVNIQSNAESICEYLELTKDDRALCHLKLHYSYGLSILNSHLQVGAALILTPHNVTDKGFFEHLEHYKATSFAGVPYTFETLLRKNFKVSDYPHMKYVTQAGGKLEAQLVKQFAEDFGKSSVKFYVMYGQTEAAPRVSYLPADLACEYPHTIGRSIPGGTLYIVDENGEKITKRDVSGELAYEGPNVMLGYAEGPEGLASDETPERLLTGDIACLTDHGLFYIIGRTKRFVKPFGIRVNLDEVQSFVKETHPQSAVTGNDQVIIIAIEGTGIADEKAFIQLLADKYALPPQSFALQRYDGIPLLPSGKYDFRTILEESQAGGAKKSLWLRVFDTVLETLGLDEKGYDTIHEMFQDILSAPSVTSAQTFNEIGSDSLSFVSLSVELENALGADFPSNWQECSIEHLDVLYSKSKAI